MLSKIVSKIAAVIAQWLRALAGLQPSLEESDALFWCKVVYANRALLYIKNSYWLLCASFENYL